MGGTSIPLQCPLAPRGGATFASEQVLEVLVGQYRAAWFSHWVPYSLVHYETKNSMYIPSVLFFMKMIPD